jgi:lipopolysaccharide biosynthesis glycosyltransferase
MCGFAHNSYQGLSLDATSSNDPVAFVTANPDAIHVAFGVDANYFRGMGVTITSVVKNNPDLQFVFHVFAFFVSEDSRHRLNQLEKKYGVTINVHLLSTDLLKEFAEFPCFAHHSLGTFIRLLIPNKLQGITKKVLYLDADILCFGSITELLSTDIDDCIAAVVHDEVETTAKTDRKRYAKCGTAHSLESGTCLCRSGRVEYRPRRTHEVHRGKVELPLPPCGFPR